jgi:hypothetical protein
MSNDDLFHMIYNWSEALGSSNDDLFYMIYTWSEAFCSTNDDLFYMIYTWSEALVLREVLATPTKHRLSTIPNQINGLAKI